MIVAGEYNKMDICSEPRDYHGFDHAEDIRDEDYEGTMLYFSVQSFATAKIKQNLNNLKFYTYIHITNPNKFFLNLLRHCVTRRCQQVHLFLFALVPVFHCVCQDGK